MKTAAQLDAEIAAALKSPRPNKRLAWADLNVLAQAASFGDVSMSDLVPHARTTANVSKTYIKRARVAKARLRDLTERGLLEEKYGDKYEVTPTGTQALIDAGYASDAGGSWLKPGARRPSWSA